MIANMIEAVHALRHVLGAILAIWVLATIAVYAGLRRELRAPKVERPTVRRQIVVNDAGRWVDVPMEGRR